MLTLKVPDRNGNWKMSFLAMGRWKIFCEPAISPTSGLSSDDTRIALQTAGSLLDGVTYQLSVNEDHNTLHGGKMGFNKRVWACRGSLSR